MTHEDYVSIIKDRRSLYPAKHRSSASSKIKQARLDKSAETPSKVREFQSLQHTSNH